LTGQTQPKRVPQTALLMVTTAIAQGTNLALLLWLMTWGGWAQAQDTTISSAVRPDPAWYPQDATGVQRIVLYFFWNRHCPHCQAAAPFIDQLAREYPWLAVVSEEVSGNEANLTHFIGMMTALGEEANGVPAFLACRSIVAVGYETAQTTGESIRSFLLSCHNEVAQGQFPDVSLAPMEEEDPLPTPTDDLPSQLQAVHGGAHLVLPWLGTVDAQRYSLPFYTVVIAGLDAFNPCAFFVLLFLLSLLVHARSRWRMLLIGGIFVLFSGLIYFLFMAAWLNIFRLMGEMKIITLIAGLVAVGTALINIKDFFYFKQGISLSIPDSAKPSLFQRMRGLLATGGLISLAFGTAALAIVANSYELLCTSGFPMVYARILTLSNLSTGEYYFYLAMYNVVYVIPLIIIVLVFTYSLGARKLKEQEGRFLKLLSGLMMFGLGSVLLWMPHLLNNMFAAMAVLVAAIVLAVLIQWITAWHRAL